jgi:hypothetical protein
MMGSSMAALNAMAAALLVWSSDRTLTSVDVERVLIDTSQPIVGGKDGGPRRIALDAALARVRSDVILRTLGDAELDLEQMVAASGLRSHVASRLVAQLVRDGLITRAAGAGERYARSASSSPVA